MFDFEGSRSEFLKLLAALGEEPAFIARARATQFALDALIRACQAKREEMLEWPTFHLSMLANQIGENWSRLAPFLAVPESTTMLKALHATLCRNETVRPQWRDSDQAALRRFIDSAERFNRCWHAYLDDLDLDPTNKSRRDYNQFYSLEKACAFGSERVADGFKPLEMVDYAYLDRRFPLLNLPKLA